MMIEKKVWPEFFQKIQEGKKNFELRLADFECNPGDVLLLKEWDPQTKSYTGREISKTVNYVFRTKSDKILKMWSQEEIDKYGFQVISF